MKNLKTVLHMARSPVAGSAGNLSQCLNKYSYYNSLIYCQRVAISAGNFTSDYPDNLSITEVPDAIEKADIIHFHNCTHEDFPKFDFHKKPRVIQLHSEPNIKKHILEKYPDDCITIAQKHAILYKKIKPNIPLVPNMFDIYEDRYMPANKHKDKAVVFYSATSTVRHSNYTDTCGGKGYTETLEILDKIKKEYGDKVEIVTFKGASKEEVLLAKRSADIVIDEVVTGGYHLTSLEGLSAGCIVINGINDEVEKVFRNMCQLDYKYQIPFERTKPCQLYDQLRFFVDLKLNHLEEFMQQSSRNFMEMYYHPAKMVDKYEKIYDYKLNQNSDPYKGLKYSGDIDRVRHDRNIVKGMYQSSNPTRELVERFDYFENYGLGLGCNALILGLGTSINKINVEKYFDDCDVFACNFYYKRFKDFPIHFWVNIDSVAFKDAIDYIDKRALVFANYPVKHIEFSNRRIWLTDHLEKFDKIFKSGIEFERPLVVTTIMTALAIYMGYSRIYIAGVDLSLKNSDVNYCYEDKSFNTKFRNFKNNYKWIIKEFKKLKHEAEIRGIEIYNLDPEPENFNVFPVMKL